KHSVISLTYLFIEAQKVDVLPEVTGYLQNDVTLSCQFIQGPKDSNITQFQWDLLQPEGEDITLAVSNSQHGVHIPESPLKGRVEIAEQSLIIKKMEMTDAGSYTCRIFTFPSGSFEGTTKLVVGGKEIECFIHSVAKIILSVAGFQN
uniref:Ig-like domain-containing protein n=1 Tax=Amphiprion ocellaris TaxID=80972 RepID=A0A3Q1BKY9_AMPOC